MTTRQFAARFNELDGCLSAICALVDALEAAYYRHTLHRFNSNTCQQIKYGIPNRRLSHVGRAAEVRRTHNTNRNSNSATKREAFLMSSHNSRCVTKRGIPRVIIRSRVRDHRRMQYILNGVTHSCSQKCEADLQKFRSIQVTIEVFKHVIAPNGNIHSCRKYNYNQQLL